MTTISAHVDRGSGHAELGECMSKALVLLGDSNFNMADGSLAMMLLFLANSVVDDVNRHPYRTGKPKIEYYSSPADARAIHDTIMIVGIAALYASQQLSQKAGTLTSMYYKALNGILWDELNGNTKIQIRPYDTGPVSPINGTEVAEEE